MVKFEQLKVVQLRQKLADMNLPISGNKAELQLRLRNALEDYGVNVAEHEFNDVTSDNEVEENSSPAVNLGLMEVMQSLKEMGQNLQKQLIESTMLQQEAIAELSKSNHRQLLEIQQATNGKVREIESKIECMESNLDARIKALEERGNQSSNVVVSAKSTTFKNPTFDGSTPFETFKTQFERVATQNRWSESEKITGLTVSLVSPASGVLQTIPNQDKESYEAHIDALQRKYGSDHMRQVYKMELRNRYQKKNERIQEFASEVERLAHLAYGDVSYELQEKSKIDAFVDGIRDPDIKRAVLTSSKTTFTEIVAYTLTQETAAVVCQSSVNARKIEVNNEDFVEVICKAITSTLNSNKGEHSRFRGKCYFCDKIGHVQKDCNLLRQMKDRLADVRGDGVLEERDNDPLN